MDIVSTLINWLQGKGLKWVGIVTWILLGTYVWSLPLIADALSENDSAGICSAEVTCTNDKSFLVLTGKTLGCGCGQGMFGQSECPVGKYGFSVAGYTNTPLATSIMSVLSVVPVAFIFTYGCGSEKFHECTSGCTPAPMWMKTGAMLSLVLFTLSFLMYYGGTFCVLQDFHHISGMIFYASGILHFIMVTIMQWFYYRAKTGGIILGALSLGAVLSLLAMVVTGMMFESGTNGDIMDHLPWVFESLAHTLIFAIAPVMLWLKEEGVVQSVREDTSSKGTTTILGPVNL